MDHGDISSVMTDEGSFFSLCDARPSGSVSKVRAGSEAERVGLKGGDVGGVSSEAKYDDWRPSINAPRSVNVVRESSVSAGTAADLSAAAAEAI